MLQNSEGRRVPDVTFRVRRDGEWAEVSTGRIFDGRTVVVFALPGAYTPTCSSAHVPRYNELAPALRRAGVDEIVCVSVNDPFVMAEWQKDQHAPGITFLPDGNGAFTRAMGMLVDKSDLNFGPRSWRYSMLVKDGVIRKMFIEPEKEGDPFEVSDADTMLRYVAPEAKAPESVLVFAKRGCPYCARAKQLLRDHGMVYEEVALGDGITTSAVRAVSGASTVPQVFIGGRLVGGAEDLEKYFAQRDRKAA
jgi:glutaredoxin-like protein